MFNMNINYCCVVWMAIKTASLCESRSCIISLPCFLPTLPTPKSVCELVTHHGSRRIWLKQITGSYFQVPYWSITNHAPCCCYFQD